MVLVLLWTMPLFMAKYNMKTKYIPKQIKYKEDEIINKPLSCTELECNIIKGTRMVRLISQNQSEILAYNIDDNQKMKSKDSYLNW